MVGTALQAGAVLLVLDPGALPPVTKILASSQILFMLYLRNLNYKPLVIAFATIPWTKEDQKTNERDYYRDDANMSEEYDANRN